MRLPVMVLLALTAGAAAAGAEWMFDYRPAKAEYVVYSGELGDNGPPTARDTKIAIRLTGTAARDMFNALGSDRREACKDEESTRVRYRGNITCSRYNARQYECHVGFDLKTGKSIAGIIC
ncbi:hypothetical protein [Cupriavidus campinensis]